MAIPVLKMATIGLLPSPLKVAYYRLRGAKIGKRVKMAPFSILSAKSITIGDDCKFGLFCFVNVRGAITIGDRVSLNSMVAVDTGELDIGNDSVIMEQCVVGGMMSPRSRLSIGKRVKVFPYCFINPTEPIEIGNDVGVGGSTYIFTHGTWKNVLQGYPAAFGPVIIEDRVWLPWRVFIMPGVTIGEDTIVGANSTITRDVAPGSLARGTPAKSTPYDAAPMSVKERMDKLHEIMAEYVEFAEFEGRTAAISALEDGAFSVTTDGRVALFSAELDAASGARPHIVVSAAGLSAEARAAYDAKSTIWFDTHASEARLSRDAIAIAIHDYLGRYGIRFDRSA